MRRSTELNSNDGIRDVVMKIAASEEFDELLAKHYQPSLRPSRHLYGGIYFQIITRPLYLTSIKILLEATLRSK